MSSFQSFQYQIDRQCEPIPLTYVFQLSVPVNGNKQSKWDYQEENLVYGRGNARNHVATTGIFAYNFVQRVGHDNHNEMSFMVAGAVFVA